MAHLDRGKAWGGPWGGIYSMDGLGEENRAGPNFPIV